MCVRLFVCLCVYEVLSCRICSRFASNDSAKCVKFMSRVDKLARLVDMHVCVDTKNT